MTPEQFQKQEDLKKVHWAKIANIRTSDGMKKIVYCQVCQNLLYTDGKAIEGRDKCESVEI